VVAVLLDNFYQAKQRDLEQRAGDVTLLQREARSRVHPLDPLLEDLAAHFDTGRSLDALLDELFAYLDDDGSGGLTFTKFASGMRRLKQVGRRCPRSLLGRVRRCSGDRAMSPSEPSVRLATRPNPIPQVWRRWRR
jgi:hypothetical protein